MANELDLLQNQSSKLTTDAVRAAVRSVEILAVVMDSKISNHEMMRFLLLAHIKGMMEVAAIQDLLYSGNTNLSLSVLTNKLAYMQSEEWLESAKSIVEDTSKNG